MLRVWVVALAFSLAPAPLLVSSVTPVHEVRAANSDTYHGSRPNILFIMADDLDVGSLQALLALGLMPNVKTYLVDAGIAFREAFVTNPICCPSRATFLSGQYSHNHKAFSNGALNGSVTSFDDADRLPTWLHEAGYKTAHIGRYLNGYGFFHDLKNHPNILKLVRAYFHSLDPDGVHRMEPTYIPPGWDNWKTLLGLSTSCMYNFAINENGKIRTYLKDGSIWEDDLNVVPSSTDQSLHHYQTDVLSQLSIDFLRDTEANDDQPFFLAVLPFAPHIEVCVHHDPDGPPFERQDYKDQFRYTIRPAPRHLHLVDRLTTVGKFLLPLKLSFNERNLRDKPAEFQEKLERLNDEDKNSLFQQYGGRLASMLALDEMIGQLVAHLQALGEWGKTLVVFTSDNGWMYGEHRLSSKGVVYEEAVRVPLYIHLPGQTQSRRNDNMVLNNDLAPTFADLAGAIPPYETDGRSLVPLFDASHDVPWRKKFLIEHFLKDWANSSERLFDHSTLFAIRTGSASALPNRVYVEYFKGIQKEDGYYLSKVQKNPSGTWIWEQKPLAREYYDLNQDPFETDNLLFQLARKPERDRIQSERDQLRAWVAPLRDCQGYMCRQLEDE